MPVNPFELINEFYTPGTMLHRILAAHSRAVACLSLRISERLSHLNPDKQFIEEAAMLHDIGIFLTDAPAIGCTGRHPYICHGWLGRMLLEERGLNRHALVCERHVGTGFSAEEIRLDKLPLPERDMIPESLEEKIICYADKFFSKKGHRCSEPLEFDQVVENLSRYGKEKQGRFLEWAELFETGFEKGAAG